MNWSFENDRPIYSQIIEHIKLFIISGELECGNKLPSVRDLAAEAEVNPNTMQRALSELEQTGLVYSQRTNGRFITEDKKMVQSIKHDIAHQQITLFFESMKKIGYTEAETIEFIQNYKKGEDLNV